MSILGPTQHKWQWKYDLQILSQNIWSHWESPWLSSAVSFGEIEASLPKGDSKTLPAGGLHGTLSCGKWPLQWNALLEEFGFDSGSKSDLQVHCYLTGFQVAACFLHILWCEYEHCEIACWDDLCLQWVWGILSKVFTSFSLKLQEVPYKLLYKALLTQLLFCVHCWAVWSAWITIEIPKMRSVCCFKNMVCWVCWVFSNVNVRYCSYCCAIWGYVELSFLEDSARNTSVWAHH